RLARRHVAAADEQRRALQVRGAAREDGAVNQVAHLLRLDGAVAEEHVGAGVDGDDPVEGARLRVAVELDEDFALVHRPLRGGEVVGWWGSEGLFSPPHHPTTPPPVYL